MNDQSVLSWSEKMRSVEKEYKRTIEPFRKDLWWYCFRLTGSPWDAEDLVQETLLKSLSMLTKVFQELNLKAYLFRIASNLWIDQCRRGKAAVAGGYDIEWKQDIDAKNSLEVIESLDYLVRRLTPKQYTSVLLVDVFQFSTKEAAEILGCTQGAVYANLNRARAVLSEGINELPSLELLNVQECNTYSATLERLLEGFEKKDPNLIASLLDDHVVTEIMHAGIEFGKDETLKNSLNDWTQVAAGQGAIRASIVKLWGRTVVVECEIKEDGDYLNNIHFIEMEEDRIVYWKFYCFSWELLNAAAVELGLKMNALNFQGIY
ncbi:RNA polymerase sigma factor [Falsibacillus pallidus]|uniref:RNA polymerase sigma factor n=1 Tax=Falsibacillus pallidus TaxID=493781 RepID=A0A370GP95_9BACI|nr:RNA polymerase sigma factor [Falsibacillus pallidus]RDI45497.1 RNA polymerase sigma-70 factor (ECF subfamily) [Falsibacillus pallidus]